ncbi:ketosynthase chain-length factor [Actinokineospora bangkokensis]|uniref:Ketosynthase chain-length factor n=1 Tax=Actinokineospora bangkokensis TaxID=1193682 RepID=A0A1Q9LC25_9PSEU|nr:ketosynthase chain-length factor [Actinokineospora bangkokensis]OLR89581.1 ketosynthase chain-length factor [Actinokineospora bangkokensis]
MTRAVVTGLGVLSPNGVGVAGYWAATLAGRSGIGPITRFDPAGYPARLAGEVDGFDAAEHVSSRLLPQTDHMTRMAMAASDWALADAGVRPAERAEFGMGVVTASASGGFEFGQRELEALWGRGAKHVSAYQSFAWFYAVNTGQISIRHGMRGPSGVLVAEQAGGLDALAQARRHVRRGTDLVVTGGVDSSLCPWGLVAQLPSGMLSTAADPGAAYLPFDSRAAGHVPGEGGAILVLERAGARPGQRSYGELAGWAAGFDPRPGSGRPPALRRTIEAALADAGADAADVDVVFADAAGTPELDRAEVAALTAVFGTRGVPVTAPKTMTGRLYSGGAPLDVAAALLSIRDGVLPPSVNTGGDAAAELDLVLGAPRPAAPRTALVLARGYGGFTSAVVLRAA